MKRYAIKKAILVIKWAKYSYTVQQIRIEL